MAKLYNRVAVATGTTGTGTVTLGSALSNAFCTFAEAGVQNLDVVTYLITEGTDFEIGRGTYTSAGTTLSRDTVLLSKIGGTAGTTKMTLAGAAEVRIAAAAQDMQSDVAITGGSVTGLASLALATGGAILSGSYTPTITAVLNVDSTANPTAHYMRLGSIVLVGGSVEIDPTAASTATTIAISIPIASNLVTTDDAWGVVYRSNFQAGVSIVGVVISDGGNDRAVARFMSEVTTSLLYNFVFAYIIN